VAASQNGARSQDRQRPGLRAERRAQARAIRDAIAAMEAERPDLAARLRELLARLEREE